MYKVLLREGQGRIPQFLMRTAPRGSAMRRVYESGNCILMKDKEMKRTVLKDPKANVIFLWRVTTKCPCNTLQCFESQSITG